MQYSTSKCYTEKRCQLSPVINSTPVRLRSEVSTFVPTGCHIYKFLQKIINLSKRKTHEFKTFGRRESHRRAIRSRGPIMANLLATGFDGQKGFCGTNTKKLRIRLHIFRDNLKPVLGGPKVSMDRITLTCRWKLQVQERRLLRYIL